MRALHILPLLLLGGASSLLALQSGTPEAAPGVEAGVLEVRLTPRVPEGREGLRWSPKGAKIELVPAASGLRGELMLGPPQASAKVWPLWLELSKSDLAGHYDRLWIDLDGDRARGAAEVLETQPSESRGKFWSSFEAVLEIPLPGAEGTRPYPLSFWFVWDPLEPDAPPILRWSRRGWHQGEVRVGELRFHVLVTESQMDGIFDRNDCWWLGAEAEGLAASAGSRSLDRHAWLGEVAYRVVALDPDGLWVKLEPFDPGETRAEEELREDRMAVDRNAARAPAPLAFEHDYEAAATAALAANKPLLVDFETTWCGPCKQMDSWVYTAAKVVDAATLTGLVAVKVDGDERRDLTKSFGVEAYPTVILISGEGVELRRKVGYQSVEAMAEFLAMAR